MPPLLILEFAELENNGCCARETSRRAHRAGWDTNLALHLEMMKALPTWALQLKASGWTHKLPPASSIETRWKVIPQGGAACGVEGKDYFLGEDRVLAHYASVHSTAAAEALTSACTAKDPTSSSTEAAEIMTPVTVVEQPQPTPHDTTGSTEMAGITASSPQSSGSANPTNGGSGDISSDAAEEDEFELVPRDARVLRPRPTAVTSQGTSLFGSSDEDDRDDEAVIVDDDGGDSNYESESVCILSSDSEDDLNKMEDGEGPNDYGGLDSGEELEEDDIVDEEDAQDGDEDVGDPPPPPTSSTPLGQDTTSSDGGTLAERVVHSAKQIDDWRNHSGQLKRVQRNCKVRSLLRTDGKRGGTTTYFCDACFSSLIAYLCMKPKRTMDEELRSCLDIWHNTFKNGTYIPDNLQGKIRLRQSPAKRRRTSSEEEKASE
ncbi:hypothetical protein PI126_g6706 [Phytophthora idaei]|nr:hypothetical protein PI126_g6706 [Phytophthora idaei]